MAFGVAFGVAVSVALGVAVVACAVAQPFRAAIDLSAANRRTYVDGVSPARIDSSTSAATTSNVYPAERSSSARRGDADARIRRTVP